jgi:hypothetical protein
MNAFLHVSFAALSAANALLASAAPIELRQNSDGFITFPGGGIGVCAFFPGWEKAGVRLDFAAAEEDAANIIGADAGKPFVVVGMDGSAAFKGRVRWTARGDGTVSGVVRTVAQKDIAMQCLALEANFPASPPSGLGSGRASSYEIPCGGGRSLLLSFPGERGWFAQDSRQWGGAWTARFGDNRKIQTFAAGEVAEWRFTVSDPSGAPLALTEGHPMTIRAGDRWARLDWHKDAESGSALDFSALRLQDAPAGKHGWLKAVGGRFEFEGLPGVEQRFYGANLCFSANYPDHELADILVARFVRCGYNAVRIHHHDKEWAKGCLAGRDTEDNAIDRLDYLLARFYAAGVYVTTDLFVSRPVPWRDIGESRDGCVPGNLYKTLVGCHDGAFADWCRWARAFLEHVNPYTGRAAKDEPGMPLISLVNEGTLKMGFGAAGKADNPSVLSAWREFRKDALRDSVCPPSKSGEGKVPAPGDPFFDDFSDWLNARVWERCTAFVRALGCRALLTNDNNGDRLGKGPTRLYDYYDAHFYVDHPQFMHEPWKLPSRNLNINPVRAGSPATLHRVNANDVAMPCVSSEWNFAGPGRYRGVGGILAGALAAMRGYDGLWRFAYSHTNGNLVDGKGDMGYFDAVSDPLVSASDRAAVCLFLRGDAARKLSGEIGDAVPALRLDKERGSMSIATPCTCGGFAEEGRIEAGPLSFRLAGSQKAESRESPGPSTKGRRRATPATIWASALDGRPLEHSSRILLVHLTDVQGEGVRYADETRQVLEKWGGGTLVEAGEAEVSLKLSANGAANVRVWALDTAGRRVAEIPATFEDGALRFRVSTVAPDGTGRIFYEMTNSPTQQEQGAEKQ